MKIFKTKVFRKHFLFYSIIFIVTILSLCIFFTNHIKKNMEKNQLYLNEKMVDNISDHFKDIDKASNHILDRIYKDPQKLKNFIDYFNNDGENQLTLVTSNFSSDNSNFYEGVGYFVKSCFDTDEDIESIVFYSFIYDKLTICNPNEYICKNESLNSVNVSTMMGIKSKKTDKFNTFIKELKGNDSEKFYYKINYIANKNDKVAMIIKYKINEIEKIIDKYSRVKNNILILENENVIYDSSNKYTNKDYPYADKLKNKDRPIMLDEKSYVYISDIDVNTKYNEKSLKIVGILPEENVLENSKMAVTMIYLVTIILIFIVEIIIYNRMKKFSNRVEKINNAIKEIQSGNFNTHIKLDTENDEFTMISNSLNDMCKKLNEYVNKVYLTEIKQKNAEIMALQNQINPHFLYNTLESIRMKAVINGDREVAKMLYNLAVLFRNMVKSDNIITIKKELEHCRLYLDLFKFRYEDKFDYNIEIDEELLTKEIIKFSIQPIIENFLKYGINLEVNHNYLSINVTKRNNDIEISIIDNGKGIDPKKLEIICESLNNIDNKESIGLMNVHERIRLIYGEKYGLTIENSDLGGTSVIVKIPNKEADRHV